MEPLTALAALLAAPLFDGAATLASGVAGNEAHRLYRQWLETANDPETGFPRNHDINRASRESLRSAVQVILLELAGRLDPKKPWVPALWEHVRAGKLGSVPLLEARADPHWKWLEAARSAVAGDAFAAFHDQLQLSDDQVRECFRAGQTCQALSQALPEKLLAWLDRQTATGTRPRELDVLVREGWALTTDRPGRTTLAHAYCLFFREHLKSDPRVYNIFTADTLNALRTRLDQQDAQATAALAHLRQTADHTAAQLAAATAHLADLAPLRAAVATLAAQPPVFSQFEAWLTPQLGEIKDLLAGVKAQLDALAFGQGDLQQRQGEVLVALNALRTESARGHAEARAALDQLSAQLTQAVRKLDYLIGGLPITRFLRPDPPTHELQLLHAKHRTVTLLGRETDLGSLCAWVESEETISARLLVGGAGTGKTRLGFELLLRVAEALPGWQAGLLGGTELRRLVARTHAPDFNWPAPTLLVVDYAQTLAQPLTELLRALTYLREGQPPLRLLLLERQPGDWFDDLLRHEDGAMPCPVRSLFHPEQPLPLTPLPPGRLRRQILAETLTQAARLTGKATPALPPPGDADFEASLIRQQFDQPLHLMLAALVAGELGLMNALRRERIDLAHDLAQRELRRVARFARQPGNAAQERALRHLTACATLERGFTAEELDRAVAEELTALKITWPDGPGDLAALLRQALPGDGLPVASVEPDFVGEALVLAALARPEGAGANRWQPWCATVERCFRRDGRNTPATLLHAFQNFAHHPTKPDEGEALLAATDALIRAGMADDEPGLLLGIEGALPNRTVALRTRAAEVTQHLYERLSTRLKAGRKELEHEVARLASNLALRLLDLGRRVDALAPAQEAVGLHRALARHQPYAFTPSLAVSLINLENCFSELGSRAEALASAQEAVDLFRALARQQPDAFTPALAKALDNVAFCLGALGRHADALAPAQEAVDLHRTLVRHQPYVFTPALADSLNTLAVRMRHVGRYADAIAPAQEAVDLYRALARQQPDAFTPGLAMSLHDLANHLGAHDRCADALASAEEAVDLRRALARQQPDAFTPDLARSLTTLANSLSALSRRADALAPAREAVDLNRALARQQPDAFNPDLAMSLNNLAIHLGGLGDCAEALAPAQEAVGLFRALACQQPDAFTLDLARSLCVIGLTLEDNERPDEALVCFAEGVAVLTPPLQALPAAHAPLMRKLVTNYHRLAQALNGVGTPDPALLAPVVAVFEKLNAAEAPAPETET